MHRRDGTTQQMLGVMVLLKLNFKDANLGGGFKYFFFHPYLGKWSNLTNIFQMGWNHQLVI